MLFMEKVFMAYIYFSIFFLVSIFLGFFLHLAFLKKTLSELLVNVAKSYDLRSKQRRMLEEVAYDYFHTMPIEAHTALSALDRSLVEVEDAITYSELALKSKSMRFVQEAIFRMRNFHKEMEENIEDVNSEMEDAGIDQNDVKKIKATWEYKAEEIIELIANHITDSSNKQKALGYRVPTKTTFRKPTKMALEDITQLNDQQS